MQSVNFLAYVGLDVHKETLAVAIASPERLGEVRYDGWKGLPLDMRLINSCAIMGQT